MQEHLELASPSLLFMKECGIVGAVAARVNHTGDVNIRILVDNSAGEENL